MILLLGGTAETAGLALMIAEKGFKVLVSTATDIRLDIPGHPKITARKSRLDEDGMAALVQASGINALVDCTHPYAVQAHETAARIAAPFFHPLLLAPPPFRH